MIPEKRTNGYKDGDRAEETKKAGTAERDTGGFE